MIKKIISIKNFGKFKSPTFGKERWNGVLEQTNVIYGNNGVGKTTLSLLFRSLKGNNDIVLKKKSFSQKEATEITLIDENNKQVKFTKGKWNNFQGDIQIFDSFFIEDNVYIITIKEDTKTLDIFEILLGEENIKIRKEIDLYKDQIKKLSNKRSNLRYKRKRSETEEIRKEIQEKMNENVTIALELSSKIKQLEIRIIELSAENRDIYMEKINQYLRLFNPNLKLNKLIQRTYKVIYGLQISGHSVITDEKSRSSLKYSLSEGDKNALSLSFFLARLDMLPNLNDYTLVIDDPISSFDYSRKSTTINNLIALSKKVKMFILMTHDLVFANDFSRKINYSCNNLKIDFDGTTSYLITHDIEKESLNGVFKDLTVLHEYIIKGAVNDTERRDIARCIRPVLEGVFRIKFFREIQNNEWLGDILSRIRDAGTESIFASYIPLLHELSEINDYSKDFHHSNPYYFETPINNEELRNYVNRTIEVLRKI